MALTREQKQAKLDHLRQELQGADTVILASFEAMTVAQDYELRKQVRESGARYHVVKNTLAALAAKGTPAEAVLTDLKGVTSIAYTSGDAVALAKALQKYAKDNPSFTLQAGVVEGQKISAAEVSQLAAMPSREEIFSKLLYLLQAPAQRLVTVLNAPARDTAVVIDQAVQANKFEQ